jgi:hypothetical protein
MKESIGKDNGNVGQSNTSDDEHLYQLIRGVPTVIIARGENEDGLDYRPLPPQSISNWDLGEDDIDIEDLDLVSPEKFETWKRIREQEKYREYLDEVASDNPVMGYRCQDDLTPSHAWRNEKKVDFTVSLMATVGSHKGSSDDSVSSESKSSSEEEDGSSSEEESSSEDGSSNGSPKRVESPGQSNSLGQSNIFRSGQSNLSKPKNQILLESPTTNRKTTSDFKGILKVTNKSMSASGQSNLEKSNSTESMAGQSNLNVSNSDKFEANEKWALDEVDEDEKSLDDEKISQLKEQINTWM